LAAHLDGPAEVTLRRPPPLERPMSVVGADDGMVRLFDGDALVAEASPAVDDLGLQIPDAPTPEEARAAGTRSRYLANPEEHGFPTCFVCGPDRKVGDGLRILVAPLDGRSVSADLWEPDAGLAGPDGMVRPEFVWAALDCPSGIGALGENVPPDEPWLLGRLAVRQLRAIAPKSAQVVIGWRIDQEGRKLFGGSALFSDGETLAAVAKATWIRLN